MIDKKFQKQLDKFGIESTQIVESELPRPARTPINSSIIKMLMDTIEGREWLYNKLDFCCVFATPFVAGKPDATAFLCGLQEVGHHLQAEIMQNSPNEYFLMTQEAAARAQNLQTSSAMPQHPPS